MPAQPAGAAAVHAGPASPAPPTGTVDSANRSAMLGDLVAQQVQVQTAALRGKAAEAAAALEAALPAARELMEAAQGTEVQVACREEMQFRLVHREGEFAAG